jgi:hypothetical protein
VTGAALSCAQALVHRHVVSLPAVIRLDAATVLLQWATGGLFFLWFTTRRREVGLGYGWLLRGTYLLMAAGALACGLAFGTLPVREVSSGLVIIATGAALVASIVLRRAGVTGADAEHDRRTARVAEMTGIERGGVATLVRQGREFPPPLDLIAPLVGVVGLVAAGIDAADLDHAHPVVALLRTLAGAAFLGAVTDAMLLGHWYLVQPGLPRRHLNELVRALGFVWPAEVISLLLPTGMLSVWSGKVDDGWNGTLGWFWGACAVTTIVLVFVTRAALRERYYSAVMAATGLLYLAILTAFGTDLVARAVLAG